VDSLARFVNEGADGRLVLKRDTDTARGPEFVEVPPPYRCPQDCCCADATAAAAAAAAPFECATVEEFREHCASPAHRAGLFAHLHSAAEKSFLHASILDDDNQFADPRLFDPVGYAALPCRRRVAKLHAYIVCVGCVLRAPLEAVELGRDLGFGFFHNERNRMDEECTELADGWEESLGDMADICRDDATAQDAVMRCSAAIVAWVAVHDLVLPDFRSRGLVAGYAHDIITVGWNCFFVVKPADQGLLTMRVINCADQRLNRDVVVWSDGDDGDDWGDGSGSGGGGSGSGSEGVYE
jgi:hypothetical protein